MPRAEPGRFDDLLSEADVERLVCSTAIRSPAFRLVREGGQLAVGSYTSDVSWRPPFTATADVPRMLAEWEAGATIVLQALHVNWHPLAVFSRLLEAALGHGVQANAFGGGLDNRVAQFNLADMAFVANHRIVDPVDGAPCTGPVGVGVSFDSSVWAICQGTNEAARLDPATGTWIVHGVGLTPYTYSDFIGFGLNVFAEPRGRYRFQLEGCPSGEFGGQRWLGARVDADIPPSTEVTLWVRTGDTPEELSMAAYVGPFTVPLADFTASPGPVPDGQYVEIEIRMTTSDRRSAPRVRSIDVAGECASGS